MATTLIEGNARPPHGPSADAAEPASPRYRTRYSRFVTLMKIALPLIAGALVLMVVAWPQFAAKPDRFTVGLSDLAIETAGGQRVVNARFTGVDGENRPFSVTADSVIQERTSSDRVDLKAPKADVTLQGDSWAALTAPQGTYWRERQVLELSGDVNLFHDRGYEFTTTEAHIDFGASQAAGDAPVHGQGPFGTIEADGFRILEGGQRIIFAGKAKLVIFPESTDGRAKGK